MIESRTFDIDALIGRKRVFHYDHADDTFTIETTHDVEPILELNKAAANSGGTWRGDMHRVASIPLTLLPELEKQGIMTAAGRILDPDALRRWLNDGSNRLFRTKLGRV